MSNRLEVKRPDVLYAVSLSGDITAHPVKPEHALTNISPDFWIHVQPDGSHHELWVSQLAALKSARRDLKRLTNFLVGLHKKLTIEIKSRDGIK